MSAATVQAGYWGANATEPTGGSIGNAETGITFSREDSQSGTTPIPIPTATGTHFAWQKNLGLNVTVAGTTSISNRRVSLSANPATGLLLWFKASNVYTDPASGNAPADAGTNGATPTGYTQITTSTQVYDNASVATSSTGRNGQFCIVTLGVDNTYTGGAGSAIALPNILLTYDEQ